ncbi:MAG: ATP-binding protein [Clostridia bacterium]|nr:ATP-binding protein [Clostridia bacterium]
MTETHLAGRAEPALLNRLLDDAASAIYVCDAQTYALLYVNRPCAQIAGKPVEEASGNTCYRYLKGRQTPCEDCYIRDASRENYTIREYTSDLTGRCYHLRGKLIDWEGRPALLEYLLDETERVSAQRSLHDLVNGLPGGLGIFHAYPDGRVELVYLNDGYYSMLGTARREKHSESVFDAVHPEDVPGLTEEVRAAIREDRMLERDIRVRVGENIYRWVNVRGNIAERTAERCKFYAFYSDIDALKRTQLQLETSQRGIEVASERSGMGLWLYDIDSGSISQTLNKARALGYPTFIPNMPDTILGTGDVFADDEPEFVRLYQQMREGAENSECTVRMLNKHTGQYEWQHVVYTRLHDPAFQNRMAIGFSINADLQQKMQVRYEHELQLRRELIKNAVNYYQLNLTTRVIEEYHSLYDDVAGMQPGVAVSETLREALLQNIAPEDKERVRETLFSDALLRAYDRGETSITLLHRRVLPGKGLRWVRSVATTMQRPNSGEIIAFLYTRDIDTERKDRLAMESTLDEEIESVCVLNVQSGRGWLAKIRDAVRPMAEEREFDFDAHMQGVIDNAVLPADRAACEDFFLVKKLTAALQKEPVIKLAYRINNGAGRVLRKKTRAFYLDETQEDIVLIRRDITDLYEEEQRQRHALQNAVDAANAANHAKSDFFSHMSHDMRTPLNAILAMSGSEMTGDATAAQKDEYLEKIHVSGDYLLGIINDVLDMSRIENKKVVLQPEPYLLDEFANTIQTVIGEQCRQKGIEFVFCAPEAKPWVMLDKVRFNQIFINLLSNAVKFTPSGGKVTFLSENLAVEGNRIHKRYVVSDTGRGMSKAFLPRAFDSFAQEERYGASTQGTGLGLSIVKQLVELMGGSITVQSELGKGTAFIVELWVEMAAAPQRQADDAVDLEILKGLRILLCEDHPLNAQIDESLLGKKGCIVECAQNGKLGCELFAASSVGFYDLVLMDIRMPVMDGLEATRTIRAMARPDAKTIPIIAMTADAFTEDVETSFRAGMNGHLSKPIVPRQLFETIAQQVRSRR